MKRRIAIHYETDQTVKIDGEEKTLKRHAFISESALLDFIKQSEVDAYGDEGSHANVQQIKLLSVSIEVMKVNPAANPEKLSDLIEIDES